MKKGTETSGLKPETGPCRDLVSDRPDNGSRSSKGSGPSSDPRKDNPHWRIKLATHAS